MDWNRLWGLVVAAKWVGVIPENTPVQPMFTKYVEPSYVLARTFQHSYRVNVIGIDSGRPQKVIVFSEDRGGTGLWCYRAGTTLGIYQGNSDPSGFGSFQNKLITSFGFVPHRYSLIFPNLVR